MRRHNDGDDEDDASDGLVVMSMTMSTRMRKTGRNGGKTGLGHLRVKLLLHPLPLGLGLL
jgi:hypothetical protein